MLFVPAAHLRRLSFPFRSGLIIALLFAALVAVAVWQGESEPPRAYDLDSGAPGGLLALRLWLSDLGYAVGDTDGSSFLIPEETDLLFVYPGRVPYSDIDANRLARWVEAGHSLVLIGPGRRDSALIDRFGVAPSDTIAMATSLRQQQPLLPEVDGRSIQIVLGPTLDSTDAPGAVTVLATDQGDPAIAVRRFGSGTVWYLSPAYDLSNGSLRSQNHGALLPPLLRHVPDGGVIRFDTFHLYGASSTAPSGEIASLQEWLYAVPAGRAILFVLMVGFIYTLLSGWRLGPPLPDVREIRRREAAEYVTAMALLQQRTRQRSAVAEHHKRRLKIDIGRIQHINPETPDAAFLEQLRTAPGRLSHQELARVEELLERLNREIDEGELVRAVAQIDRLIQHPQQTPSIR